MSETDLDKFILQLGHIDPANPDAQWQAAIKLGDLGDAKAVSHLVAALQPSNQALVRAHAAQAFWKLIDSRDIDHLIQSLKDDPYYLVRSYAARALGKLRNVDKDRLSVQPLIHALQNDSFFGVRAEAAEALRVICKDDASEVCTKAKAVLTNHDEATSKEKDERQWRVTREVERALKEIEDALNDLSEQGSKMSKMSPEELSKYWKKGGKRFLGSIRQIRHGTAVIGAQIGAGGYIG
ncbi:MAG TPA: HEAT repeat domain-containing protein [Nitrososphaerales archaeon]